VRANRAFLRRAVRYLAGEAGIRQFLDIGSGLPAAENTHEVAQRIAPESRVVYVDNDPIVLAHARVLLDSTAQGATACLQADARDPVPILREAARTLDFSRPVAVMMLGLLHYIPDSDDPPGIVSGLMGAMAPGSYLALSEATRDIDTERVASVFREDGVSRHGAIYRSHEEPAEPRDRAAVAQDDGPSSQGAVPDCAAAASAQPGGEVISRSGRHLHPQHLQAHALCVSA
jgi:hypothetical protein